ncbi:hypothetical protein K466DRAFT_306573 [Polyporus arcularius HHB13444]|uniref:C2H2-type domain-containing protein n=1 Tax=Polyporus arcularius HHB13444 TaxID=1314778 RepID=A0A5C3P0Y3_9APHY|nr:hypothetical protein K466DRAFT_306573 [Polyporus arcularius HHB13444]
MQQSDSTTPTALLNPQSHRGPTIIAQSGQRAPGTNVLPSQSSSALPSATTTSASLNASGFSRTFEHPSYSLPDFRLSAHGATHTLQVAYGAAPSAAPPHSPPARESLAGMASVSTPSAHAASAPTRVPAPTPSAQATVGHLDASAAIPATPATTSTASSERWPCPLCSSDFGRVQELNRHLASVHRRGGSDGPLWACCGVPVEDARSKHGMSEEEVATSRRGQYNGRAMVGGCWSSNFSRRDAYARHLRDQHCIGDPYGEYHLGNQLG